VLIYIARDGRFLGFCNRHFESVMSGGGNESSICFGVDFMLADDVRCDRYVV
jgi:hypothetical protein